MVEASTGTNSASTSSDTAAQVTLAGGNGPFETCTIRNAGPVGGYYSLDSGTTYHWIAPAERIDIDNCSGAGTNTVYIKRVASGNNMSNVHVSLRGDG